MHKNLKDILKLNVKKKEMTNGKIKTNKKASVAKIVPICYLVPYYHLISQSSGNGYCTIGSDRFANEM